MEQFNSGELSFIFEINSHKFLVGQMIVGKYVWQQEEELKEDISTALMFQEQFFTSELFKVIQDAIPFITGQCINSERFLRVHLVTSDVQSI